MPAIKQKSKKEDLSEFTRFIISFKIL